MAIQDFTITLNGSGAATQNILITGLVTSVRVERSSGTPTVTIADSVNTGTTALLNAVAFAADATYAPQMALYTNAGVATGLYGYFYFANWATVTITGGAAAGTVTLRIKTL